VEVVVTRRNSTNTDAELAVNADLVNQSDVQGSARGDTRRSTETNAVIIAPANHVNQLNVQNDATGDSRGDTNISV